MAAITFNVIAGIVKARRNKLASFSWRRAPDKTALRTGFPDALAQIATATRWLGAATRKS